MAKSNPRKTSIQQKSKRLEGLSADTRRQIEKGLEDLRKGRLVKAREDYSKYLDKPT